MTGPLYFTEDAEANALLGSDALALLIGLVLYQQVPVEKAFMGPAVLRSRLGGRFDAESIAAMEPGALEEVFATTPAIHRFPAAMAKRVHGLCSYLVDEYDGRAEGVWLDGPSAADVVKRLKRLPGFGDYKARVAFTVLARRLGVRPDGWEDMVANFPTVADIDGPGQLEGFKARKKAWKER